MTRREFLEAGAAAAGALLAAGCPEPRRPAAARDPRPDLLLFLTDDQHFRTLGSAGARHVATPHLDALAARGTAFATAYAAALPCAPARGCIMTGRSYARWRRTGPSRAERLEPGEWTWAHVLRQAGYRTALIGKMHFDPMRAYHGFEHAEYCEHAYSRRASRGQPLTDDYELWLRQFGVRDWQNANRARPGTPERAQLEEFRRSHKAQLWPHDPELHPISWLRDRSIAYLEERGREAAPFCLTVGFRHPHAPYNPSPRFAEQVDPASLELPTGRWTDLRGMPAGLARLAAEEPFDRDLLDEAALRRLLAFYYALVAQVDDAIGAILRHVDPSRTLVLFTSDHGAYLGARGRLGKHPFVGFEPVARVPLLASGPGVPPGARCEQPVSLVDLAPTLLSAAGIEVPGGLDGEPLQAYFRDPDFGAQRAVVCTGLSGFDALRRGRFKYFESRDGAEAMLFDLEDDPDEWINLAGSEPLRAQAAELARELARMRERPPVPLPRFPAVAPS